MDLSAAAASLIFLTCSAGIAYFYYYGVYSGLAYNSSGSFVAEYPKYDDFSTIIGKPRISLILGLFL